ncbi:M24 family metallopeptidase [Chloroflexota bacterium]
MANLKWNNTFSEKERDLRWKLVRDYMRSKGLDAMLALGGGIWYVDNGRYVQMETFDRYLSGWGSGATVLFPLESEPVLMGAPEAEVIRWTSKTPKEELPWIKDVRTSASAETIATAIKEKGLERGRIMTGLYGYGTQGAHGPDQWTSTVWGTGSVWSGIVKRIPDCKFENLENDLLLQIAVCSEERLAMVRQGAAALEEAMTAVAKAVRIGASALDVYLAIINTTWRNGAVPSEPYVTAGPFNLSHGELWPHGFGSPRILEAGDVVNCGTCVFAYVGGQEVQSQITVAIPPVHKETVECARIARETYEAGLRALQPGRPFREVAEAMSSTMESAGAYAGSPNIHDLAPHSRIMGGGGSQESIRIREENYKKQFTKEDYEVFQKRTGRGVRTQRTSGYGRSREALDNILKPGMVFEFEPTACIGNHRVNVGGTVIVTETGNEELNEMGTRMRIVGEV